MSPLYRPSTYRDWSRQAQLLSIYTASDSEGACKALCPGDLLERMPQKAQPPGPYILWPSCAVGVLPFVRTRPERQEGCTASQSAPGVLVAAFGVETGHMLEMAGVVARRWLGDLL